MTILPGQNDVRHTKEDALGDRDYQLLLEGADAIEDDDRAFQARFIILVAGRLGLRAGEICHMSEDWLNRSKNMIEIPRFDPCSKGRDGSICGYCETKVKQYLEYNEELTRQEAVDSCWSPKTEAAARRVPYDFDPRANLVVERFFDRYDQFPHSRSSINRRVSRAAQHADGLNPDDVYPHALRGTAATFHASRGLNAIALQSLFGWAQLSTAQAYIRKSGEATRRELQQIHSR